MNIVGKLLNIKQAETLLLEGQEVGSIGFQIQTETQTINAYALASDGTAYHALENNLRFRGGVGVKITGEKTSTGFKALTIRLDQPDASGAVISDIQALKARAMQNINLAQGELHALLSALEEGTPQHYAIAVQLRRQHRDRTVAIADKVCRCEQCRGTFELDSPRYTFAWGKSRCPQCKKNVAFDLVEPLPREDTDSKPDWHEMQKRIQDRFGGKKG